MRNVAGRMLLGAGAPLWIASCASPTEIVVDVYSEVSCRVDPQVGLIAGPTLADLASRAPSSTSVACDPASGHVGSVVLQPSGAKDEDIAFEVMTQNGPTDPSLCNDPAHQSKCIVARRELRFEPHQRVTVRVDLRLDCLGVPCDPSLTCVNAHCVSPEVPLSCETSGAVCDESSLGSGSGSSSGADSGSSSGADSGSSSGDAGCTPLDAGQPFSCGDASCNSSREYCYTPPEGPQCVVIPQACDCVETLNCTCLFANSHCGTGLSATCTASDPGYALTSCH
jgi:hypothetical protein